MQHKTDIYEKIEINRHQILPELYEWAETFDWEFDEEDEKTMKSYNKIFSLAERFKNGLCDDNDYRNILFHIDQINYNETKIKI